MSLTTVLLAFLPAIVRPKLEPEKSERGPGLRWAREKRLEAERDALKRRVRELEGELDYVRLERDSARRRLDGAWDTMARLARERIGERLEEQQAQAAAQYQGLANPLQQAAYQQMQAGEILRVHRMPFAGELIDCTGGGRSRHLTGALGAIGGA